MRVVKFHVYSPPPSYPFLLVFPPLLLFSLSAQISSPSSLPDIAKYQHGPPDCNGQCRASIASSRLQWAGARLQWAVPDLNRGALERPGQRRTSTGGSGTDWATPDLSREPPERSGQCRTSVARRYVRRWVRNMSEKNKFMCYSQ